MATEQGIVTRVTPEVDDRALRRESGRIESIMSDVGRITPDINTDRLRKSIESAIPGGRQLSRLLGGGGSGGGSRGAQGDQGGQGQTGRRGILAAQLDVQRDIRDTLEDIEQQGGGGGGGGGIGAGTGAAVGRATAGAGIGAKAAGVAGTAASLGSRALPGAAIAGGALETGRQARQSLEFGRSEESGRRTVKGSGEGLDRTPPGFEDVESNPELEIKNMDDIRDDLKLDVPDVLQDLELETPDYLSDLRLEVPSWLEGWDPLSDTVERLRDIIDRFVSAVENFDIGDLSDVGRNAGRDARERVDVELEGAENFGEQVRKDIEKGVEGLGENVREQFEEGLGL